MTALEILTSVMSVLSLIIIIRAILVRLFPFTFGSNRRRMMFGSSSKKIRANRTNSKFDLAFKKSLGPLPDSVTRDQSGVLEVEAEPSFSIQTVYFGTNRKEGPSSHRVVFGSERSEGLNLGQAHVGIPRKRKIGTIRRPRTATIAGLTIWAETEDPSKHLAILDCFRMTEDEFLVDAASEVKASERFKNSAFLFVHGFNVTFDDALYRAAQLAFDLNFDGPAFVYSWPSVGKPKSYVTDMDSASLSSACLDDFIDLILKTAGVEKLHVVVHSMGNAALAKLVQSAETKLSQRSGKSIDQLILAAPDIDVGVFNQVAKYFTKYAKGVTLYACRTDKALLLSKKLRNDHPRAGDVPENGPAVFHDIDTIDVSAVGTSVIALNHSVYAEDRGVLDDVGRLMMTGERPPERRMPTLKTKEIEAGRYWIMPK